MSTYNGQNYLADQINSIINQSNRQWHLYIRDDGSNDNTPQIIRQFAANNKRITFVNDQHIKNIGVVRSFMSLLNDIEADFYMFSDQDDFWKPQKVQHTLDKMLSRNYQELPVCVHTDLLPVDKTLKHEVSATHGLVWSSFQHLLFWNCVTGCTMMINQRLKEKINFDALNYHNIYMHDWWLALVAAAFGEVVFLNEQTMLYRQHGNNVVGSLKGNSLKHRLYQLIHAPNELTNMKKVIKLAYEFRQEYGKYLTGKDKLYIKEYGNLLSESSILHNIKLAIKLPPRERTWKGSVLFAYLMVVFSHALLESGV